MLKSIPLGSYTFHADDTRDPGRCILENGFNYEKHVVTELRRLVPSSTGFLDIGANVGIHTFVVKSVNSALPVSCIECSPFNLDILCRNVAENRLENVTIYPFAASHVTGIIKANDCPENTCCTADMQSEHIAGFQRYIPAFALDDLPLHPVDLIKIDVEGMEIDILRGASKVMAGRPRIIFEYCPEIVYRSRMTPIEMLQWFLDRGYKLTTLDYVPNMRATFTNAAACLAHIQATSHWIADILAEPV